MKTVPKTNPATAPMINQYVFLMRKVLKFIKN